MRRKKEPHTKDPKHIIFIGSVLSQFFFSSFSCESRKAKVCESTSGESLG